MMTEGNLHFENVSGNVTIQQAGGNIIAGNQAALHAALRQRAAQQMAAAMPYKFLASYDISDRDIFFGREAVIEDLLGKIPRCKILLINGRSGAGKTSLLHAGLIPRLAESGYVYLSFRDYSDPLRQLREYVTQNELFKAYAEQARSPAAAAEKPHPTARIRRRSPTAAAGRGDLRPVRAFFRERAAGPARAVYPADQSLPGQRA